MLRVAQWYVHPDLLKFNFSSVRISVRNTMECDYVSCNMGVCANSGFFGVDTGMSVYYVLCQWTNRYACGEIFFLSFKKNDGVKCPILWCFFIRKIKKIPHAVSAYGSDILHRVYIYMYIYVICWFKDHIDAGWSEFSWESALDRVYSASKSVNAGRCMRFRTYT